MGQNVAADDRRTFTNTDKVRRPVRRVQSLGNDNKDAILDCESGFHQSGDKRNCHKLNRSSYVTSIVITKLTFAMFLLKVSTLPLLFSLCFISFVAFICIFYSHVVRPS